MGHQGLRDPEYYAGHRRGAGGARRISVCGAENDAAPGDTDRFIQPKGVDHVPGGILGLLHVRASELCASVFPEGL